MPHSASCWRSVAKPRPRLSTQLISSPLCRSIFPPTRRCLQTLRPMGTCLPELRAPSCPAACPPHALRAHPPLRAPSAAPSSPTAVCPPQLAAKKILSVGRSQSSKMAAVEATTNTTQSSGQTVRSATRLWTNRLSRPPVPPPYPPWPPERTSPAGKAASPSWSPLASWISLPPALPRRSFCKRKRATRALPSPPALRHRSLTGGVTSWRPSPRTHCPPPLTAPKRKTLSWAPALTDKETKLLLSPPHPVLCPAKAEFHVPFIQPPPLSSWLPSICPAHRQGNLRVALQQRAGNVALFDFFFLLIWNLT